jgi:RNA polymerase sigma factor (sigma-70 family)
VRLVSDRYCYANPYLEPVSLDHPAAGDGDEDAEPLGHGLPDEDANPLRDAERLELQAAVQDFVAGLDERDRLLLTRVFWDEVPQADVARTLQVSGAAISKRLRRIIEKARLVLAPIYPPPSYQ